MSVFDRQWGRVAVGRLDRTRGRVRGHVLLLRAGGWGVYWRAR
ncbi:hypothetical protein [Deinococcus kurensis]|nr:hypothetical protein [Deinococcus kurensis]